MKEYESNAGDQSQVERGAGLAEYGLLLTLVAVVCIPALIALAPVISQMISASTTALGG